jgi:hypothetical protein
MSGWHCRFYDNVCIPVKKPIKGDPFESALQKTTERPAALYGYIFWQFGLRRHCQAEPD